MGGCRKHGASPDFSSNLLIGEWKSEKNLICVLYIGKKAIEVYYAVVIAVAVVAGIVMPNV